MKNPIVIPAALLALWSLGITFLMFINRLSALKSKKLRMSYFRVLNGSKAEVPEKVAQFSRHYTNLFEMTTLFYVLIAYLVATHNSGDKFLFMGAWAYLLCRIVHSVIHLSYNDVTHRLIPFFASATILTLMWGKFLLMQLS